MFHENTQRVGIQQRISQGVCWYPISIGKSYYNSLNQLTIEIIRSEMEEGESLFEHGRPISFFKIKMDGKLHYLNFSAVISYVQEDRMVVILPNAHALMELNASSDIGIQLHFDDTSYKTMFAALREVIEAKEDRLAHLREVLLGGGQPSCRELRPISFPWLNRSQEKAVNKVLNARDVAVVHGPPGTGKTTTLVEAVFETLNRENQVLVCAQSNTAVDCIAEKLVDRGVPVLRIGHPTRVNDKMLAFTYERRFEAHPDYPELWNLRRAIREGTANLRQKGRMERDALQRHLAKLRTRATELEIRIDSQLFQESRVIASTLVGAANRLLERKRFSSLFIDEAAQAIEAASWIAIAKADRVILAGDHCQLPPTIKCVEAAQRGLGITLLEKIVRTKPETVSLLEVQYRMHKDIMQFSSHWFYQDRLRAASEVSNRSILELDSAITWIDTADFDFNERSVNAGIGRMNEGEAKLLIHQLKIYIQRVGENRILDEQIDIGIISPYRAQVHYLRYLLKKEPFFRPFRRLITVHTVDGFQGQERDVILISLVRANAIGQIGFLRDLRRMNVAMTRARMKLIILGDCNTLVRHPFYQALYEYIERINE
jgi:superfamily I DNA and/or RNA helicase